MSIRILAALLILAGMAAAQELPDAPKPSGDVHNAASKLRDDPKFFSFRGSWQDPPLRTNRQMFRSKTYVLSQIGGFVAMAVACRNKRSGESWGSEVPAVLLVDGMAYLGGRFFTQSYAVAPGVYEMVHYSQAAAR